MLVGENRGIALLNRADFNVRVFFFNLHSGGWNQGPLDTAAT
jgi:hypothetical protein